MNFRPVGYHKREWSDGNGNTLATMSEAAGVRREGRADGISFDALSRGTRIVNWWRLKYRPDTGLPQKGCGPSVEQLGGNNGCRMGSKPGSFPAMPEINRLMSASETPPLSMTHSYRYSYSRPIR